MKTEITWTDRAWERYRALGVDFGRLRGYYGDRIADEHQAEFYAALAWTTFAAGPVNISADGNDSFLIVTPVLTIGLIWTPDSDEKLLDRLNKAGVGCDACETVPANWPRTGRWSAHS